MRRMSDTFRKKILSSYLHDEELYEVIWHTWLYYVRIVLSHLLISFILIGMWLFIGSLPDGFQNIISYSLGICIVITYFSGLLKILDAYLDGILITNMWLILFQWDWLFKQRAINLQRVSIETIVFEQDSLRDTVFHKWTLSILVEDQKYIFLDVSNPRLAVSTITARKEKILWRVHYSENEVESEEAMSKYEVLVEALGEVVTEYVQKKQWSWL
jgi:hypothetical protein